jgi:hypothetical protein
MKNARVEFVLCIEMSEERTKLAGTVAGEGSSCQRMMTSAMYSREELLLGWVPA